MTKNDPSSSFIHPTECLLNKNYVQLPDGFHSTESYVDCLLEFLEDYGWLWHHNAVDFYVKNYWETQFLSRWKFLKDLSFEELIELGSLGKVQDHWPKDLKDYIQKAKHLGLPRDVKKVPMSQILLKNGKKLDQRLMYGMSLKKRHEVENLACLIHQIGKQTGVENVIDIGAGQGYLDTSLVFQYGMYVIGVDDDQVQTKGAMRKLEKISKRYTSNKDGTPIGNLYYVNRRIHQGEGFSELKSECENLIQAEKQYPKQQHQQEKDEQKAEENSENLKWMLCGLHTCGDLAVNIFRQFLNGPASVMINIGCCYNHISEIADILNFKTEGSWSLSELWNGRRDNTCDPGFPVSEFLLSKNTVLGFTARMLACQSIVKWADEMESSIDVFHRHFSRAVLQAFVVQQDIASLDSEDVVVGRLGRDAFNQGFVGYAKRALKQMKSLNHSTLDLSECKLDEKLESFYKTYKGREKEVAVVWTLRALLAEAIESLILMDRFMYLEGQQKQHYPELGFMLIPIFDQKISPRNMAFCTWKASHSTAKDS